MDTTDAGTVAPPPEATADAVQPPASTAPLPPEPSPVEAAAVAEVEEAPTARHVCENPGCGAVFGNAGALGGHRSYCDAAGGVRSKAALAAKAAPPPPPPPAALDPLADVAPPVKGKRGRPPARPGVVRGEELPQAQRDELVDQLRTLATLRPSDVARGLCATILPPELTEREAQLLDAKLSAWKPPPWLDTALVLASIFGPRIYAHPAVQKAWTEYKATADASRREAEARAEVAQAQAQQAAQRRAAAAAAAVQQQTGSGTVAPPAQAGGYVEAL